MAFVPDKIDPEIQRQRDIKARGIVSSELQDDPDNPYLSNELNDRDKKLGLSPSIMGKFVPDSVPAKQDESQKPWGQQDYPPDVPGSKYAIKPPPQIPQKPHESFGGIMIPPNTGRERVMNFIGDSTDPNSLMGILTALNPSEALPAGIASRLGMPSVPPGIKQSASKIMDFGRDLLGSKLPGARQEASNVARQTIESGITQQNRNIKSLDDLSASLDKALEATKTKTPNLDVQGSTLRNAFNSSIEVAKKKREETADKLFGQVRASADKKEQEGFRVDTSKVLDALEAAKKESAGISDLESNINKMISSIKSTPVKPIEEEKSLIAMPQGVSRPSIPKPPAPPQGKTFEQLEKTRRYLNDIAYNGETEGYSAILRNHARDAAASIDEAMTNFLPEFGAYKKTYKEMSEPLESLNTRLGRALSDSEGGLQGEAYSKVSNADLPNRLFTKKEGIDLLVDALSGGKNASTAARKKASTQVDKMVENWLMEDIGHASPDAGLKKLNAPKTRAALSGVPKVQSKVEQVLTKRSGIEAEKSRVGELSKSANDAKSKIVEDLSKADSLSSESSQASKQAAYDLYVSTLSRSKSAGLVTPKQYEAARGWIDRASTLQEKNERARKLVYKIGGISAGVVGTYETYKAFQ